MSNSESKSHQTFLIFVEKYTTEAEMVERKLLGDEPSKGLKEPGPVDHGPGSRSPSAAEPEAVDQLALQPCIQELQELCDKTTLPVVCPAETLPSESFAMPFPQKPGSSESETSQNLNSLGESLKASRDLLTSDLATEARHAAALSEVAFMHAQESVWDVFSESMLTYDIPTQQPLDLLEVYAYADSRLTDAVRSAGGLAQRFTKADGDLATPEGQRKLYDLVQKTQPKHKWMALECRLWGSWSQFNASRSSTAFHQLQTARQADRVHMRLCARIHA